MLRSSKPRRCCICKTNEVANKFARLCTDMACILTFANRERDKRLKKEQAKRSKLDREDTKRRKEAIKTRRDYIDEAQKEFNAYIRARDADKPCICCGRTETTVTGLSTHGLDCGHYRSVGSAPHLRFNEDNAHRQLVLCNRYGAGRAVDYRIGLIKRLGLAAVEALESDNTSAKWSIEDLKEIKAKYRRKLKELLASRE